MSPRTFSDTMPPAPVAMIASLKTRIAEFMRARSIALRTCKNAGEQPQNVDNQLFLHIYS